MSAFQVVQKTQRKDWHEDLLGGGILGVLKAWLEPVNGCLPLLEVHHKLDAIETCFCAFQ